VVKAWVVSAFGETSDIMIQCVNASMLQCFNDSMF